MVKGRLKSREGLNIGRYLSPDEVQFIRDFLQRENLDGGDDNNVKAIAREISRDGTSLIPAGFDFSRVFVTHEKSRNRERGKRGLEMVWSEDHESIMFLRSALTNAQLTDTDDAVKMLARELARSEFARVRTSYALGVYLPGQRVRMIVDELKDEQSQSA